jgi:hypothetical protein
MIIGRGLDTLPPKKRHLGLPFKKRGFKIIHEWCANRHERSRDILILSKREQFSVRNGAYCVNGHVVATISSPETCVVLWANGLVEWLCIGELFKFKEAYRKWWMQVSFSRHDQKLARLHARKLNQFALAWITEHERILANESREEDFLDGSEFVWK